MVSLSEIDHTTVRIIEELDAQSHGILRAIIELEGVSVDMKQPGCGELWLDIDETAKEKVQTTLESSSDYFRIAWCGPHAQNRRHLLVLERWY